LETESSNHDTEGIEPCSPPSFPEVLINHSSN
jgi:hypothetical protein